MTRLTEELTAITAARTQSVANEIILVICPGYDIKLRPVMEFRRGIMRLPFAATTSGSPLSKV